MRKRSMWVDGALKVRFQLASEAVQREFEPDWLERHESQYHNVYELAPGLYGRLDEDGLQGEGLYVFSEGDWALRDAKRIDSAKPGWLLRLLRLIEQR
jgi:hypothetical protein